MLPLYLKTNNPPSPKNQFFLQGNLPGPIHFMFHRFCFETELTAVREETFRLIERILKISAITQGAFDISYGLVDKMLWNIDKATKEIPNPDRIKKW